MIVSSSAKFHAEIERFLNKTGMTPTVFGRRCLKDPMFVFRLRKGRVPGLSTVDKVRAFIAAQKKK